MPPTTAILFLALVLVARTTLVCRSSEGLTKLLYRACKSDPFCIDQYPGLALAEYVMQESAVTTRIGDVQNRPFQGFLTDSRALGFVTSPSTSSHEMPPSSLDVHVEAVIWGAQGMPDGGLVQVDATAPEALDCATLTAPYPSVEVNLTLRLASAALVRYRQSIVSGPLCTDPMRVRVYSPTEEGFVCVCRENHDCEQPKYEIPLLTFLFLFGVILIITAAACLGISTRDFLHAA